MVSQKQCELARLLTGDSTPDAQISFEFLSLDQAKKTSAAQTMDIILKQHNLPFDKGFSLMKKDFSDLSAQFAISPATLFCIYMDWKSKKNAEAAE